MPHAVDKALEMIGEWRAVFGDDSAYNYIHVIYSSLELKGFTFPKVDQQLASASYVLKPPAFADTSKSCFFCSKDFGGFTPTSK